MTEARKPRQTLAAQHARARMARMIREVRRLERERQKIRDRACTGAWADSEWFDGVSAQQPGMVLSAAETRWGETGRKSRRWTPRDAVDLEDMLDVMTKREADRYVGPSSCGSVVTAARLKGGYVQECCT